MKFTGFVTLSFCYFRSQFGPRVRDVPRQARRTCERRSEGNSKSRRKPNSDSLKEASHASGSWVNPRSNAGIPKDAGKRRVRADGRQSGHWFTGQDGRKVMESLHLAKFCCVEQLKKLLTFQSVFSLEKF